MSGRPRVSRSLRRTGCGGIRPSSDPAETAFHHRHHRTRPPAVRPVASAAGGRPARVRVDRGRRSPWPPWPRCRAWSERWSPWAWSSLRGPPHRSDRSSPGRRRSRRPCSPSPPSCGSSSRPNTWPRRSLRRWPASTSRAEGLAATGIGRAARRQRNARHQLGARPGQPKIVVTFANDVPRTGRLAGVDSQTGIAVITVAPQGRHAADLAGTRPSIGEPTVMVGGPGPGSGIGDRHDRQRAWPRPPDGRGGRNAPRPDRDRPAGPR